MGGVVIERFSISSTASTVAELKHLNILTHIKEAELLVK